MSKQYSYKLYEYDEAINPYGIIETKPPIRKTLSITNFIDPAAKTFHTTPTSSSVCLSMKPRLLGLILDQSGSSLYNDYNKDRIEFYKKLLENLNIAYPDKININLIGFGGIPVKSDLFLTYQNLENSVTFNELKTSIFSDSVYDLAGIRVVRKTSGYPINESDGTIVADGIFDSIKDDNLNENTTYYYSVFPYNKNNHFSSGTRIKFSTHDKILPNGVNSFSANARILPGARRDEYTSLILNFSELYGSVLYDSSGNNNHVSLTSPIEENQFWQGATISSDEDKYRVYVGGKFSGEGYIETISSSDRFVLSNTNDITSNVWVYRNSSSLEQVVFSVENDINWQYQTRIDTSGRVRVFSGGGIVDLYSSVVIPEKEWTMITVVFSNSGENLNTSIYINGIYDTDTTTVFPATITTPLIRIGDSLLAGDGFIGAISSFSYHDFARQNTYIENLYIQESKIFYVDEIVKNKEPADNGQREVLLSWNISDDFNYDNGIIKIVKKYNSVPSNYDDGETILEESVTSPGTFTIIDSENLINGSRFNYRFFTVNSLGNQCSNTEARIASVFIPNSIDPIVDNTLPIINATLTPASQKIKINWNAITDSRVEGVRIYYSTVDYPVINSSSVSSDQWDSETEQLFTGKLVTDTTDNMFVHRTILYEKTDDEEIPDELNIPLENGTVYYYSIICYDCFGNISEPFHSKAVPSSENNVVFIPDNITDLWAELVNRRSISIHWTSPSSKIRYLKLWFGQQALFYVGITDLYGTPINSISGFNTDITQYVKRKDSSLVTENEYIYNISSNENGILKGNIIHTSDIQKLSSTENYKFVLSTSYNKIDPLNSNSSIFNYILPKLVVEYENPMMLSMVNLLDKRIDFVGTSLSSSVDNINSNDGRPCQKRFCGSETSSNQTNIINGGYIGSKEPYICRVFISYQNEPVPDGTQITVQLYKSGTQESPDYVTISNDPYIVSTVNYDGVTETGVPYENSKQYSYVDITMYAPVLPEMVDISASFTYQGISISGIHTVLWASTLKFQLDVNKPAADGIDIAEQLASIYFVDPDYYNDIQKRKPVPDDTIVKWKIENGDYFKERPFYSLDTASGRFSGVYSRTKNGIARNVWFGPVSNIENHVKDFTCQGSPDSCCIGEEYKITAQVIINNETIQVSKWIGYSCEDAKPEKTTYSRILMDASDDQPGERPHYFAYADGEELIHLQIASDPGTSTMSAAECFRKCMSYTGGEIVPLPCNQIVSIYTGGLDQQKIQEEKYSEAGMEIIWNAEFDIDPYSGEKTLLPGYSILTPTVSALSKTEHIANVPIKKEITDVYLRLNKSIGLDNPYRCKEEDSVSISSLITSGTDNINSCQVRSKRYTLGECTEKYWRYNNVQEITCNTSLIYNNKILTMSGGGSLEQGIPPVIVGFKEPLRVEFVEIRTNGINGQRATDIVADGKTSHIFVIKVTFSGKPVPDGTPVQIRVSSSLDSTSPTLVTIYTHSTQDPVFDPLQQNPPESLTYFELEPLADVSFSMNIDAVCNYDKRGDVSREIKTTVGITNTANKPLDKTEVDPQSPPEPRKTQVYSNEIIIYDIDSDTYWTDSFSSDSLLESRAGHFSAIIGTFEETGVMVNSESGGSLVPKMYLIGGFNGNKILSSVEVYELGPQLSYFSSPMPTPRSFGQTAVIGEKIYCIGGIEYDSILKQFSVSRKIEVFDSITNSWNPALSSMPEGYGVAFGQAIVKQNDIYILCGCNTLSGDSEAGKLNDKILKYNSLLDEWTIINVLDLQQYSRIAPFCFIYNDNIYVDGGCIPKDTSYLRTELKTYIDFKISEFTSSIYSSSYYLKQKNFDINVLIAAEKERLLKEELSLSPFHYPETGFIFDITTETITELDEQWIHHPKARSRGACVFDDFTSSAFFIGGSNDSSVTTRDNESISLINGSYSQKESLLRGRTLLGANIFNRQIYISGGFTSGHSEKWVSIDASVFPNTVEARGLQTSNLLITLRNDAGELLDQDIRVLIRGTLKIPGVSERIAASTVENATARIVAQAKNDPVKLKQYLQNLLNPNSDEFQFGTSRKLGEDIVLFPVLFTKNDFIIHGTGTTTLLPRSEDPLNDIETLAKNVSDSRQSIRDSIKTDATGTTSLDQINALEDVLSSYSDTIKITSDETRDLYSIELQITILDKDYFGQTICSFDLDTLNQLYSRINSEIQVAEQNNSVSSANIGVSDELINNSLSSTDSSGSGQSTSSKSLFGIVPVVRKQATCPIVKYFNNTDWIPQIFEYLNNNSGTIEDGLEQLDLISDSIPFGSSQLYDAIIRISDIMTDENFVGIDKNIYVNSDSEENLSSYILSDTIDQVNSIDGSKKVPIIYTVFSTSFPPTISSQLAQGQSSTVELLANGTGGHSSVLTASRFLPSVLNFVLSVSGGLGYGLYRKVVDFGNICSITKLTTVFDIFSNTKGYIRYRYSDDRRTWFGWTDNYEANNDIIIDNLKTRYIEFEITLESGFVSDPEDPYMATGIPCAIEILWEYSAAREDFIFLNTENTVGNVQQVETAVTGNVPYASSVKFGAASADSSNWLEFETDQRPALEESRKTILLDRQDSTLAENSIISRETLTTKDGIIFTSIYGPWSDTSDISIYEKDSDGNDVLINDTNYRYNANEGVVIMNTKHDISKKFYMSVVNENKLRVGLKLSNSNHEETISIEGVGYIYSTNNIREPALSQVPPTANMVVISPQTPMVSSEISVTYKYIDLNRNEEIGTLIKWFRNGAPLLEINNKLSWTNEDLLLSNRLKPDDIITVSVTPSDNYDYGSTVFSSPVKIINSPPVATNATIVPTRNGLINSRTDTGSILTVKYDFVSPDTGVTAIEEGTKISFFVNGNLFKTNTYSLGDDQLIKKSLFPFDKVLATDNDGNQTSIVNDVLAYDIGNNVYVEVIPKTKTITGGLIRTPTITIQNSLVVVKTLRIEPVNPSVTSTLNLVLELEDPDFLISGQTNQTEIQWYKSTDSTNFVEITSLKNQLYMPPSMLVAGDLIRVRVLPSDGIEFSAAVTSNSVRVLPV